MNSISSNPIAGSNIIEDFLSKQDMELICRGHQVTRSKGSNLQLFVYIIETASVNINASIGQVVEDGYEFFCKRKLITLFSAPNYCGYFDNAAAFMVIQSSINFFFFFTIYLVEDFVPFIYNFDYMKRSLRDVKFLLSNRIHVKNAVSQSSRGLRYTKSN